MRKIVTFDRVSADGYFAARDGSLEWVVQDPELDQSVMSGPGNIDTFLLGRRTYELLEAFWRYVPPEASAKAPHGGGEMSEDHRKMETGLNQMGKIVFSRTLKEVSWQNARIDRDLDPDAIAAMKQQPGKDMLILGSGSIVSQLTKHRLIDEYQIVISPTFLGSGLPLISNVSNVKLDLVETKRFPTGNVMLRYTPR